MITTASRGRRRLRLLAVFQAVMLISTLGVPLTALASISSVTPNSMAQGASGSISIVGPGGNFPNATSYAVTFSGTGVTATNVVRSSSNTLTADVTVTLAAATGSRTLTVSGTGGFVSQASTFTVTAAPVKVDTTTTITSDTPDPSMQGAAYVVNVSVTRTSGSATVTGNVVIDDGTDSCTDTTPTGGGAATVTYSCSLTSTTAGAKNLTATYAGNASFNGSLGNALHTVTSADGSGTMTANTAEVGTTAYTVFPITPGMAMELIDFNFTSSAAMGAGSQLTIVIPAGWTPPTLTAGVDGAIRVNASTCAAPAVGTGGVVGITGSGPWTITLNVQCNVGQTFSIRYGNAAGVLVYAAGTPGTYTFTTQTKGPGGTLTGIAAQPQLAVVGAAQTITFPAISGVRLDQPAPVPGATASSALAVTYSTATGGVCSVTSGGVITMLHVGTCTIDADQAGDATYSAASQVSRSFTVSKGNQAIALIGWTSPAVYGDLQALGTSGASGTGAVTYISTTPAVCTVISNELTIIGSSGTCSVYASMAADADWNAATSATVDITAGPAVLTVTPAAKSVTYGDSAPAYTFGVTGFAFGEDTGTAAGYTAPACTSVYTSATSVGASPVTITCSGGGATNYTFDTSATAQLTIGKAGTTTVVTCGAGPFTYDGSAQTPCSASVTGVGGLSLTPAPTYANNTNAGTASAGYAYPGDTDHSGSTDGKTFDILKADPVLDVAGWSGTYDGNPHGASGTSTGVNAEDLSGDLGFGASFTSVPGGTGHWTFTDSTGNYNNASGDVPIDIGQATLTVTPDPQSVVFGDPIPAYTFGVTRFVSGEDAGNAAGYVAPTCDSDYTTSTPVADSPRTISCSGGSATNYAFDTSATASLTVSAASQATLAITGPASKTYGNAPFAPTTSGGSGSGAITFTSSTPTVCTASGSATVTIVGAGTCSVTATKAADADYGATMSASFDITVDKADASCAISGYSGTYDAAAHGATGSCPGIGGENAGTLDRGSSFTDVPGGTAHWTFTGNANYNDDSGDVPIEINPADPGCSISGWSGDYDGNAHGASGSCAGVGGEDISGDLDLGASFTEVPGGTAHWAFTDSSGNYTDDSGSVPIEITAAPQVIEFPALPDVTFGVASFKLAAATASGLPITYTSLTANVCTVSGATVTVIGIGTCTVQASQVGDANHAAAQPVNQSFLVGAANGSTPETSTGSPFGGQDGGNPLPLGLILGLAAVAALGVLLLLLDFRARREETSEWDAGA